MEHPLNYSPSGKMGPMTVPQMLVGGVAAGVLVGALYGVAAGMNPLTFVNPVLLIAAGLGLAAAVRAVVRWSRCRNPWVTVGAGLIAGAAAVYASWVTWIFVLGGASAESLFFSPGQLRALAGVVAIDGVWTVLGATVNGAALQAVWMSEALLMLALPAAWPALMVLRTPYGEIDGTWATQRETVRLSEIKPDRRAAFTAALRRGSFDGLARLKPAADDAACFTLCTRRFPKNPGPTVFLTLVSVDMAAGPSGKPTLTQTRLTRDLAVDSAVWSKMRDRTARVATAKAQPAATPAAAAPKPQSQAAQAPALKPANAAPANFMPPNDPDDRAASPNGLPGMPPAA